ncbi:MAG TPA: hypothetical protein DCZ01_00115 [Elusimicrobia bacterium]|nr:MAG: hypothetical protein A2X37_03375 [Elusimicrobia bacterium GWA2_66_18]OGR74369.1 MAG: hypothetical protein A2X40_10180 [Elusimicrobia bacterium GWC2_65_9]HAZ06938.1 hypothetical protein [Elusimicrobiota bacterium]
MRSLLIALTLAVAPAFSWAAATGKAILASLPGAAVPVALAPGIPVAAIFASNFAPPAPVLASPSAAAAGTPFAALELFDRYKNAKNLDEFLSIILRAYDNSGNLNLSAGPEAAYAYGPRLQDVSLHVGPNDDERAVAAETLARGTGDTTHAVREKLAKALAESGSGPVSLRHFIPAVPRELTNQSPSCEGPNCWNATLLWDDPGVGVKYVKRAEMEARLMEQYAPLKPGDKLSFGDVIVIYGLGAFNSLLHTARYIDSDLVWHKASYTMASLWTFESLKAMMRHYWGKSDILVEFRRLRGGPRDSK